jgi:hypothetical protein
MISADNILSRGLIRVREKEKYIPRVAAHVVPLTTFLQPLPERVLHIVRSSALPTKTWKCHIFKWGWNSTKGWRVRQCAISVFHCEYWRLTKVCSYKNDCSKDFLNWDWTLSLCTVSKTLHSLTNLNPPPPPKKKKAPLSFLFLITAGADGAR